jgi:hypothetical protein
MSDGANVSFVSINNVFSSDHGLGHWRVRNSMKSGVIAAKCNFMALPPIKECIVDSLAVGDGDSQIPIFASFERQPNSTIGLHVLPHGCRWYAQSTHRDEHAIGMTRSREGGHLHLSV